MLIKMSIDLLTYGDGGLSVRVAGIVFEQVQEGAGSQALAALKRCVC